MKDIIKSIEDAQLKPEVDSFRVGDTVRVSAKVVEGSRERRAKLYYLRDRIGKRAKVKELVK